MASSVARIIDTIGGMWELARLAWVARVRGSGSYWRWRNETAFGTDPARMPSRMARLRAVLAYGRWVYRMKRGR